MTTLKEDLLTLSAWQGRLQTMLLTVGAFGWGLAFGVKWAKYETINHFLREYSRMQAIDYLGGLIPLLTHHVYVGLGLAAVGLLGGAGIWLLDGGVPDDA